jgi:hypothetical protein
MTLKLDKNNIWSMNTPNLINLFTEMMKSETDKKYLTLNQCSKILYSINQSIVLWGNDEYIKFINSLKNSSIVNLVLFQIFHISFGVLISNFVPKNKRFVIALFAFIYFLLIWVVLSDKFINLVYKRRRGIGIS